jgi:hypothetical protein
MVVRREEYRKKRVERTIWGRLVRMARPGMGDVLEADALGKPRLPIVEDIETVPKPRLHLQQVLVFIHRNSI